MKKFSYCIIDELGLHARTAGQIAKTARQFESYIQLSYCHKDVADAKKIMEVMGLNAVKGDVIDITIEGSDENEAESAMINVFNELNQN